MAENLSLTGTASETINDSQTSYGYDGGSDISVINDNDALSYAWVDGEPSYGNVNRAYEIVMAEASQLSKIGFDFYLFLTATVFPSTVWPTVTFDVDAHYDSAWHDVGELVVDSDADDWSGTHEINCSLTNVTKVRITVTAEFYLGGLGDTAYIELAELKAWGATYEDKGLRISGQAIGVVELDGHVVRAQAGGVTYGIPLLDTSDSSAGPIRIKTPDGIKAFPKIT